MQYPRRRASKAQATSKAEVSDNIATVGVRPSAGTVGQPIPQRNVQYMERSASLARRGICQSSQHNHSQSCGGDGRKSRKDMHESSFKMQDYDSVNVQTVHFTTDVHHTAHTNIAFDEISSDRKLQCLPTDVKISNESVVSSTVRIKLDTGACGNLLPFNIYRDIHPHVSIKDLCKTIDKRYA